MTADAPVGSLYSVAMPRPLVALVVLAGCGSSAATSAPDGDAPSADAATADADLTPPPTEFGGDRSATLAVPEDYVAGTPIPLVLALHGYFTDPGYVIDYMALQTFADDHGVLMIAPHGTVNPAGFAFWNATGACCDLYDDGVDDEAYLMGLIADIRAAYTVDPRRIHALGHSNGGFMSLHLACRHPDVFAAVISHAGAADPDDVCAPGAVSVLQVHGSSDTIIAINGGFNRQMSGEYVAYPSAADTVARFAAPAGCDAATETIAPIDLTTAAGDETTRVIHTGCPDDIDAELWTTPGGGHFLGFSDQVPAAWWTWLENHAKPQ